jgi:hypothetical protein
MGKRNKFRNRNKFRSQNKSAKGGKAGVGGKPHWRRRVIIITGVMIIWAVLMLTDLYRTRMSEPPLFAVPILRYDSGSVDYYGLFYKIWKDVNILNGDTEYYMTAWFVPKFISPGI